MLANYGLPLVNVEDMDCDCSAELRAAGIVATFGGETELDLDNDNEEEIMKYTVM